MSKPSYPWDRTIRGQEPEVAKAIRTRRNKIGTLALTYGQLWRQGLTVGEISDKTGKSKQTIYTSLVRQGLAGPSKTIDHNKERKEKRKESKENGTKV